MSDDLGWYAELTEGTPSQAEIAPLDCGFFGTWTQERLQREVLAMLLARHEIETTSFQRSRCKPLPPGEPGGTVYVFPHADCGLALTARQDGEGGAPTLAVDPAVGAGTQHRVRIDRAHLLPNRVQAVIEGAVLVPEEASGARTEIPVVFHDHRFAVTRGFYRKGLVNDFILSAFADMVRPAAASSFELPQAEWMKSVGIEPAAGKSTVTFDLGELATWMEFDKAGLAAYEFRGRVESVTPMPGETDWSSKDLRRDERILGVRVWRVRTLVAREPDFHLDIFVSDADGGDYSFLQPGAWIEGFATMSGHCCW